MVFGLETDTPLEGDQLEAIHRLEIKLDRTPPRVSAHIGGDGVTIVVTSLLVGYALTAMWRFRGDVRGFTVSGADWWHVFAGLDEDLCKIFKVREEGTFV